MRRNDGLTCQCWNCTNSQDVCGVKQVCVLNEGCPGVHCRLCKTPIDVCWNHDTKEQKSDTPNWLREDN